MRASAVNTKLTSEQAKIANDRLRAGQTPNGAKAEAVREMLDFVEKDYVRLEGITVKQLIHEGHQS